MNDLLSAVDSLTLPVKVRVTQDLLVTRTQPDGRPAVDGKGNPVRDRKGTQTVTVEHDPLLVQLEDAIREAMATVAGDAASLKSTRGMIDAEALYQFTRISTTVRDWSRMAGAPRRDTISDQLRAWYVTWTQEEREESHIAFRLRMLNSWAGLIRDKLDPHDEYVQPGRCPMPDCPQGTDPITGKATWFDPRSQEERTDPLVVMFRRTDGPMMVLKAKARCKACGTVWSVRELAWALEQAEKDEQEITPL